jgi:predicted nuclease with TOPRIM domain
LTPLLDQIQARGRELLAKLFQSRPDTGLFYSVWDTFRDDVIDTCARPVPELFHDYIKEKLEEAERIMNDVISQQTEIDRPLTEATARVRSGFHRLKSLLPELRDRCTDAKGRPLRKDVERIGTAFEEFAGSLRSENQIILARAVRRSDKKKHTEHVCITHLDQCWHCLKPPAQQFARDGNYDPWKDDHVTEWRNVVESCERTFTELFPPPADRTRRVREAPPEKAAPEPIPTPPEVSSDADAIVRRLRREISELKCRIEQLQAEIEEARAHGQDLEGRLRELVELQRKVVTLTEDLITHRDRERELLDGIDALERRKSRLLALAVGPAAATQMKFAPSKRARKKPGRS